MTATEQTAESKRAWRLRVYPIGALMALWIAVIVLAVAANGSETPAEDLGGDFPAFYGAARIASDGDWAHLYDFERQVEAQRDLQETPGSARYFAYPPQVAWMHAPLAKLQYGWAYLAYTAVMFAMLVSSILLAEPMLPWLQHRTWLVVAGALSFWPMLRAVTGGSNTALSLLVVVASWRLIEDDHELAAGLVLSVLLFKPQLAVPLVGLMLIIGMYRVVVGAAVGSVMFYLAGVPLAGWSWPVDWWEIATNFNRIDSEVNGFSSVSWLGFLENARGVGDPVAVVVGWGLAAATTLALIWIWRRNGRAALGSLIAIAMPGILLLSPHALSHDTAIILITLAVLQQRRRLPIPLLVVVWVLGLSQAWIEAIGFSPGFFLLLVVASWTIHSLDLIRRGRAVAEVHP